MNILEKIGLLFKTTLNKWFTKLVDLIHDEAPFIHQASTIISGINNFVQGSGADILTAIIPGTLDDSLKVIAREWLPKIIQKLNFFGTCAELTDPEEIVQCFATMITGLSDDDRTLLLHNAAALLAQKLSGDKLTLSEIYGTIEAVYQSIVKPKL